MTTEERLATLEGRTDEHAAANADIRAELRQGHAELRTEIRAIHTRIDALNARFDRLLYTMLGLFVAQAGVILTIVLRT